MTDVEFDAIALKAFGVPGIPCERVWRGSIAVKRWDWLPTPGESLAMACLASAVMGAMSYAGSANGDNGQKVRLRSEIVSQPFESAFLAVSKISGADQGVSADSDSDSPPAKPR